MRPLMRLNSALCPMDGLGERSSKASEQANAGAVRIIRRKCKEDSRRNSSSRHRNKLESLGALPEGGIPLNCRSLQNRDETHFCHDVADCFEPILCTGAEFAYSFSRDQ